jgi:hypothetical protein
MADIINWITTNWAYIVAGLAGLVLVSSIIVKLTPTTKDDSFMRKVVNFFDHFSIFDTADNKALIERSKKILGEESK